MTGFACVLDHVDVHMKDETWFIDDTGLITLVIPSSQWLNMDSPARLAVKMEPADD